MSKGKKAARRTSEYLASLESPEHRRSLSPPRKSTYVRKYATDAEANEARRVAARKQHAAAREAAGYPITNWERIGRKAERITDPDVEDFYFAEARRVGGILDESMTHDQQRRVIARYAESQMLGVAIESADDDEKIPAPLDADDAALEMWQRYNIDLWEKRLARDEALVATHRQYLEDAERALGALLLTRQARRG